jgi:dsRNA-specific ribonuclease
MSKIRFLKKENPKNQLITVDVVENMLKSHGLDIKVNNIKIYQTAFSHKSYVRTSRDSKDSSSCVPLQDVCNETYEYLGDTILSSVIGTYLYDRYYDQNEGFLTKTRSKMVRGPILNELSKRLKFQPWILISNHVESEGGRENPRMLEDLFESFIAAIYLDNGSEPVDMQWFQSYKEYNILLQLIAEVEGDQSRYTEYVTLNKKLRALMVTLMATRSHGYMYCQRFIMSVYEQYIDIVKLIAYDDNYKDQLQTYFQTIGYTFPKWEIIREEGKTNNRWHTVGVRDRHGYLVGVGRERKKTDAEQLASRNALVRLGVIAEDHDANFLKT